MYGAPVEFCVVQVWSDVVLALVGLHVTHKALVAGVVYICDSIMYCLQNTVI